MIICGVDIGGSKIACASFRFQNGALQTLGATKRVETQGTLGANPKGANASLAKEVLGLIVDQLSALDPGDRALLKGVGIGCCGIIDQSSGILRYANKLTGVRDLPFARYIGDRLRQFQPLKDLHVAVENDANAAGLGEALHGSGAGLRDVVYLTISTGVGGVLVIDGKLQRGTSGKAGEFGSLYLGSEVNPADPKQAVWSKLVGGKSVAERVVAQVQEGKFVRIAKVVQDHPTKVDMRLLAECARSGDFECQSLFQEIGHVIGIGIANLVDLYDPDCVIIGGGMVKAFDLWSPSMFESLFCRKPALRSGMIRTARLGDMVGTIGAAAVCSAELFAFGDNERNARNKEIAEVQSSSTPRKLFA